MLTLAVFAGICIIAACAWTYWLMLKVIRPNDAGTTQLQQLNDRMLRMLETADARQGEALDRLFSADRSMVALAQQVYRDNVKPSSIPMGGVARTAPAPPPSPLRATHDDDAFYDDDLDDSQREKSLAAAARREDLQEAGAIGVPASDI